MAIAKKKPAVKKAVAAPAKTAAKKTVAVKKAPVKKTVLKTVTAAKTAAVKKTPVKKVAEKKTAAVKKAPTKQAAVKKSVAKKAVVQKTAPVKKAAAPAVKTVLNPASAWPFPTNARPRAMFYFCAAPFLSPRQERGTRDSLHPEHTERRSDAVQAAEKCSSGGRASRHSQLTSGRALQRGTLLWSLPA